MKNAQPEPSALAALEESRRALAALTSVREATRFRAAVTVEHAQAATRALEPRDATA